MNDEVFIEKKSTPYRDANCQYYPYIPYLSHFTNLQISSKVKTVKVLSFNNSYIGFLCLFGTSETKNIGRVMMLTKHTFVSTKDDTRVIYAHLKLDPLDPLDKVQHSATTAEYFVVVNAACIRVKEACFRSIDLKRLKETFIYIECYRDGHYLFINYKAGLLFKRLEELLWVTSKDIHYWIEQVYGFTSLDQIVNLKGNDFIVSYSTDIIRHFKHNAFPKNILTLNSLKNAVLSITSEYSLYFKETISAYTKMTDKYKHVLKPVDEVSNKFAMYLPKLNLMYASFKGCTQEDCIVMRSDLKVFNIYRFYTVKLKFNGSATKYFHPMTGKQNPSRDTSFLGTVTCETGKIVIASQTMHLHLVPLSDRALDIYFKKPNFTIMSHKLTAGYLFISIESFHKCSTGDKLCTLHGQKGVLFLQDRLPYSQTMCPEIIINPYCIISRQTCGQIVEAKESEGKDVDITLNSDGKIIRGRALVAPTFYFPILYLSNEHIYVATNCTKDKLLGQPVRGRSRQGGMRSGNMELLNGFRGNGIGSCFEEIMLEHSDKIVKNNISIPQSVILCNEDANFFKCDIKYETEPILYDTKRLEVLQQDCIYNPHDDSIIP
ncbi:uncharacterized protein [Parasteatoda tepidariorum]|uniref:uncharacterized protein n=1 Tax=Parasteatoda tepidariorum TaxID=114398 RepID=UPI0039BCC568